LIPLLNHKLLFVTGKGGVGKTSLSLALGLLAAEKGKKTIVVEVHSEEQVSHLLQRSSIGYQETELLPHLWGININPRSSFEEYVLLQIKLRGLYKAVFENKLVRYFIEATPGLSDLMCIGKIYALSKSYDLVIVDAPATGHSLALLEISSIVCNAIRLGPLNNEAQKIDRLLHDAKQTKIVPITLPEDMPVTETIELYDRLDKKLKLSLGPVFLNQVEESPFSKEDQEDLKPFLKNRSRQDLLRYILTLHNTRTLMAQSYSLQLKEEIGGPIIPIPFIYSSQFGLHELEMIAEHIEGMDSILP